MKNTLPTTKLEWVAVTGMIALIGVMVWFWVMLLTAMHDGNIEQDKRDDICTRLYAEYISLYEVESHNDAWGCYKDHQIVHYQEGDVS